MKRFIEFAILLLICLPCHPQSIKDVGYDHLAMDIQQNLYVWKGANLWKFDKMGTLIAAHSIPSYGIIHDVDPGNSIKSLVFHKESGIIELLDNKLSASGSPIRLFDHGMTSISSTALFGSSSIILFDETNQYLYISDFNLNLRNTTKCDFNEIVSPQYILVSQEKTILLIDSIHGIYTFDQFGSYLKRIPIIGITSAHLSGKDLYYAKENQLYKYNMMKVELTKLSTEHPLPIIRDFHIDNDNSVIILNSEGKIIRLTY